MKKLLISGFAVLAVLALVAAPFVTAGEGCGGTKTTDAKLTSGKTCAAGQQHAVGQCTPEEKAACAAKLGLTAEDCEKFCKEAGYEIVQVSINGMTCVGCENSIKSTLTALPGVVKVGKVSHQEGLAVVVVDTKQTDCTSSVVKAVTNKGYKAEIIPAVATSGDAIQAKPASDMKTGCAATCGAAAAAACKSKTACSSATTKTTDEAKKAEETKKTDGTN